MTPDGLARIHARAMLVPRPWSAETFKGFLSEPGSVLALSGAGFALGRVIVDEAELLTLAVDPDARRRGHARACLAAFEAQAVQKGAARAFLEVAATNGAARALYASAGYAEDRVRRGYYVIPDGDAIDAAVMSKTLLPA